MQPRFRSILWRELPPFVRRACVGWSRFLLHTELYFCDVYLTWTRSPTWNFVGIAGTIGIVLTILLFLVPREFLGESTAPAARMIRSRLDQQRRPWELDSTLSISARSPAYPVEIAKAPALRYVPLASDLPPRRRRLPVLDDPPQLEVALELVTRPRRIREPDVPEVSLSARMEPVATAIMRNRFGSDDPRDPWRPFDPSHVVDRDALPDDRLIDQETVAASLDGDRMGLLWEPAVVPSSAASSLEVELELSWDRTARTRTGRSPRPPQLHIRNLGPAAIPRIDVLRGELADTDFTVPQRLKAQILPELPPGQEHAASRIAATGRSGGRREIVSVLVTAFVGNQTMATPAVVQSEPRKPREPAAARPAKRPHLTLTTGAAKRLKEYQMLSAPMRVVNDGNVRLDGVVIIAEIPPGLEHRYGRTVHLRIGTLQPNEERRTMLLLTPLEAGEATVTLKVSDDAETASDDGVMEIQITAADVAAPPDSSRAAPADSSRADRQSSTDETRPRSRPRRRTASAELPNS